MKDSPIELLLCRLELVRNGSTWGADTLRNDFRPVGKNLESKKEMENVMLVLRCEVELLQ